MREIDELTLCEFFAHGEPVAQPRLRPAMSRQGRLRVLMPQTAQGWRLRVLMAAKQAWGGEVLDEPLEVDLLFWFARPKGHHTPRGALRVSAPRHHTTKPDRDNLEKSTLDALNGVLWRDDSLVVGGYTSKRYVDELQTEPGALVTVRRAL
jgi:Holliday junction resolvase RusA-like endonuclease